MNEVISFAVTRWNVTVEIVILEFRSFIMRIREAASGGPLYFLFTFFSTVYLQCNKRKYPLDSMYKKQVLDVVCWQSDDPSFS